MDRIIHQHNAQQLRLAAATIESVITLVKGFADLTVKPDNPEAIEFLKSKRRFQKTLNKLKKLFPDKI